uniref:Uncharacterized protein n=1 Tax=Rhizophora mucronata TaxID=61149 RepID=A0A2P2Q5U5_RHIMU
MIDLVTDFDCWGTIFVRVLFAIEYLHLHFFVICSNSPLYIC